MKQLTLIPFPSSTSFPKYSLVKDNGYEGIRNCHLSLNYVLADFMHVLEVHFQQDEIRVEMKAFILE